MIKLIAGLGNPGPQYEETRHNVGQMVLDALPFAGNLRWQSQFKGRCALYNSSEGSLFFLKPMTFMNCSGESVGALARFYKILPEEIMIVHDELDIEFGKILFKKGGGLAGHNGLKSVKEHLGTDAFLRLRVGISRPNDGRDVVGWVLDRFSSQERKDLPVYLAKVAYALEVLMSQGFDKATSLYGRKNLLELNEKI